ncbi:MAG TPA: outer membrane beta-barrel protein [Flavisolibacter sp.]|nr:outer membrane beta-barrel protein [Flavisolibacter sp.]
MSPDMEDLMRKAAEAYPLKQVDDRWAEIASKIEAAPAQPGKKQKGYRRYFILMFMLFMFLFTGDYFINRNDGFSINTNKKINQPGKETEIKQNTNSPGALIQKINQSVNEDLTQTNNSRLINTVPVGKTQVFDPLISNNERSDIVKNAAVEETISGLSGNEFKTRKNEIVTGKNIQLRPNNFSFELHNRPVSLSQNSKQKNSSSAPGKKFYYGLTAGAAFNSVKEQKAGTGWNLGLLVGYHISNRLSLETGFTLSKKYYWTSGDYFSMKKVVAAMPPPMKIMEVDGDSRLIEIPLHFRYDVFQNSRRSVFSSAGFSSYILTKEYNQYHTSTNGNMQMMYGTYKNNQLYFAASLDAGLGYEQKLGTNKAIRFQPYIQIPVKGIGMGDLRIRSIGLRIALTKQGN